MLGPARRPQAPHAPCRPPGLTHHFNAVLPLKNIVEVSGSCSRQLQHHKTFWGQANCVSLPSHVRSHRVERPQGLGCANACSNLLTMVFAHLPGEVPLNNSSF